MAGTHPKASSMMRLELAARAAATIAADDELIIVGSQAVLARFSDAPEEMLRSDDADVYPKNRPERWELIDGAIGELSLFMFELVPELTSLISMLIAQDFSQGGAGKP